MKNLQNSIKEKLLAKYLVKDSNDNKDTKSTDINILLNRVRTTKKTELKKKIIFVTTLLLSIVLLGVFTLI